MREKTIYLLAMLAIDKQQPQYNIALENAMKAIYISKNPLAWQFKKSDHDAQVFSLEKKRGHQVGMCIFT